ncbi:MAG: hypothetical protein L3J04_00140 [Robiginitomaculum sp.]|nr:hypothetical protein [Robiginitomaculum sp.]
MLVALVIRQFLNNITGYILAIGVWDCLAADDSKTPLAVANTIRNIFQDEGVSKESSDSATPSFGMSGILVNKDTSVWDVDHRLALARMQNNKLWARGSGIDYALGADYTALAIDPQLNHQQRVRIATEAAISCDTYCPGEAIISQFV